MSKYPAYFQKLFQHILTIDQYLFQTFNIKLKNVVSTIDQEILKNKIIDRVVIGIPHSTTEYGSSTSSYGEDSTSSNQDKNMKELIDEIRHEILTARKGSGHILTSGAYLSLNRDISNKRIIMGKMSNTITNELFNHEWNILLKCIGEKAMRHLIKNTVLLVRVPNDNYYQLSGPRINLMTDSGTNNKDQESPSRNTGIINADEYTIRISSMLYNNNFFQKPSSWMSNTTMEQLKIMFPKEFKKKGKKFPQRLDTIKNIIERIIQKNARSKPRSLLHQYCPYPKDDDPLDRMQTIPNQVYRFIREQVRRVFSLEFFGSEKNLTCILELVKKILKIGKREVLYLPYMLEEFDLTVCQWLKPPRDTNTADCGPDEINKEKQLLYQAITWFINNYVFKLIKSYFYVTEANTTSNKVIFFHAEVWKKKSMELVKELLTNQRYEKVDSTLNNTATAKIRFVPKGKNIRIITDMSNINRVNKSKLQKALKALAYERNRKQLESIGKSVTNSLELFKNLLNYKSNIFKHISKDQKLYFVKTDVMSSFDSIDQNMLLEILKNILEKQYNYKSFVTTYSRSGEINWKSELRVQTPSESSSSEKEIQKLAETFTQSIWIEGPNHTSQNSEELLQLISDHIQNSVTKIQGVKYRQTIGIPQGSSLSTMLCDHFYTQMENECLDFIKNDPNALLLRYVDDFLLITPDVSTISRFCRFIEQGKNSYGVRFNQAKSATTLQDMHQIPLWNESEISWCGLNININTLDVSSDFSRYKKNNIRDLMSLKFTSYYKDIQRQITQTMKTKQTRLLVDINFNSKDTIYRNMFETYILAALKFGTYVRQLLMYNKRISWKLLFKILLQAQKETASSLSPYLSQSSIHALFLYACFKILNRKHKIYEPLLNLLGNELKKQKASRQVKRMVSNWPRCSLINLPLL